MSKLIPTKPLLILLYGFPGAGKTYFGRQLCEQFQAAHMQADRIRSELFDSPRYDKEENNVIGQLMDYMTEEFLSAGLSVVYDVNAMRQQQRMSLREMARNHKAQPILIWFQIDPETAFLRAAKRDKRHFDDKYAAPMDQQTFESIASGMQNPTTVEDYVVISGKHVFTTQYNSFVKRMQELGLLAPTQAAPKMVKPGLVNLVPQPNQNINGIAGRVDMARRNISIR
jgi:predicted kinase